MWGFNCKYPCVWVHVDVGGQDQVCQSLSTLFFKTGSLTDLAGLLVSNPQRPEMTDAVVPPYMDAGNLNFGLQDCTSSMLPAEPALQPPKFNYWLHHFLAVWHEESISLSTPNVLTLSQPRWELNKMMCMMSSPLTLIISSVLWGLVLNCHKHFRAALNKDDLWVDWDILLVTVHLHVLFRQLCLLSYDANPHLLCELLGPLGSWEDYGSVFGCMSMTKFTVLDL